MSSRSSPKRSSSTTGERLRRYARHSEARRLVSEGGAMTHTSRPRRWTTNRPRDDSIRSRILEKERLASVADTRSSRGLSDPVFSDFLATNLIVQRLPQQVTSAHCLSRKCGPREPRCGIDPSFLGPKPTCARSTMGTGARLRDQTSSSRPTRTRDVVIVFGRHEVAARPSLLHRYSVRFGPGVLLNVSVTNRMRPVHPGEILKDEFEELGMSARWPAPWESPPIESPRF